MAVKSKSREGLEPAETAIPCHVADLVARRVLIAGDTSEHLAVPLTIVWMDEVPFGFAQALLHAETSQLRPRRVQKRPAAVGVALKDNVPDAIHHGPVALFAGSQRGFRPLAREEVFLGR